MPFGPDSTPFQLDQVAQDRENKIRKSDWQDNPPERIGFIMRGKRPDDGINHSPILEKGKNNEVEQQGDEKDLLFFVAVLHTNAKEIIHQDQREKDDQVQWQQSPVEKCAAKQKPHPLNLLRYKEMDDRDYEEKKEIGN